MPAVVAGRHAERLYAQSRDTGARGKGSKAARRAGKVARAASGAGHTPFKSRAQWRWAFATHKPWARGKAHATEAARGGPRVGYRSLPTRTAKPTARTAR
jgi:hypothetical protein